jgi:hypothetical protein
MSIRFNQAGKVYISGNLPFNRGFGLHFFMSRVYWENWSLSVDKREIDVWGGPFIRLHVFHNEDA